jgi:hypothetical protein
LKSKTVSEDNYVLRQKLENRIRETLGCEEGLCLLRDYAYGDVIEVLKSAVNAKWYDVYDTLYRNAFPGDRNPEWKTFYKNAR